MLVVLSSALAQPHALQGRYTVDDPDALEVTRRAAVETVVMDYPWAFRGIARPRVRKHVWNCGRLGLDVSETTVAVHCDDKPVALFPIRDGVQDWVDSEGTHYGLEVAVDDTRCRVVLSSSRGQLVWTYRPDGDGLELVTEVTSPVLPADVVWTAAYRAL